MIDNAPVWTEINCVGETTGSTYFGRFELKKYLSNREKSDISRLFEAYVRGISEDIPQRSLLYALAQLNFHIVSTDATWWVEKGMDLLDDEPVVQLMSELRKHQTKKDEKATKA